MKREIAEKWVAALRSGKYQQTYGKLTNEDRSQHCCLGVLCELAIEDGVKVEVDVTTKILPDIGDGNGNARLTCVGFGGRSEALPKVVREWAGMHSSNGEYWDGTTTDKLTDLNDNQGLGFPEIADVIDRHAQTL